MIESLATIFLQPCHPERSCRSLRERQRSRRIPTWRGVQMRSREFPDHRLCRRRTRRKTPSLVLSGLLCDPLSPLWFSTKHLGSLAKCQLL